MKSYFHERPLIVRSKEDDRLRSVSVGDGRHEDMVEMIGPDPALAPNADSWHIVPKQIRTSAAPLPEPWEARFGPLRKGTVDDLVVVGQIGQSIDGRIATVT